MSCLTCLCCSCVLNCFEKHRRIFLCKHCKRKQIKVLILKIVSFFFLQKYAYKVMFENKKNQFIFIFINILKD